MMLSYTIPEQEQHRRVRVRLEGSAWSAPFSLDQVYAAVCRSPRHAKTCFRAHFYLFFFYACVVCF